MGESRPITFTKTIALFIVELQSVSAGLRRDMKKEPALVLPAQFLYVQYHKRVLFRRRRGYGATGYLRPDLMLFSISSRSDFCNSGVNSGPLAKALALVSGLVPR